MQMKTVLLAVLLSALAFAQAAGAALNVDKPEETVCGTGQDFKSFACSVMLYLLQLGPIVAVIALVVGGAIYVYANVFVTADQRGKYHTLAVNLAIGALILAALVGGAGILVKSGMHFLSG